MHIDIDRELCEGYGVCVQSAPEVFALDDEGDSVVLRPEVDGDLEQGVVLAEKSCPMQAVRLS
ncbi:ferredoxin [Amycolatopsis deserti]|uniref:Ferredoxin n=1 Tax=Amycolatopsis deserti TaxID=185696 RepID=A0ABQ3IHA0_9PSEU|nr:ferredoxin [Amycolatopsis deserti]GHE80397.1 ferredoxin [Amycolatopsis deserti]